MASREERYPSRWMKAADVPTQGLTVTIVSAENEEVGEDREEKLVLRFKEISKGLVCNATNWDAIAEWHGDDDAAWVGKRIKLYPTKVAFQKKMVDAIRVVPKAHTVPAPPELGPEDVQVPAAEY